MENRGYIAHLITNQAVMGNCGQQSAGSLRDYLPTEEALGKYLFVWEVCSSSHTDSTDRKTSASFTAWESWK